MEIPMNTLNLSKKTIPQVLTIAGSDPGGGAGIQGDLKAIAANGGYALSVLTAVTAQNSLEMSSSFEIPLWMVEAQFQAILSDFKPLAAKTGMLSSRAIVEQVAQRLASSTIKHLVVDPVMLSKSGYALLKPDAIKIFISELLPLASLLTPNIPEAEVLAEMRIRTIAEAKDAARKIVSLGCPAVLVKGGHLPESPGCDILLEGDQLSLFKEGFIQTPHTHGTGCTYSAAIATRLALGHSLHDSVAQAKNYLTAAIKYAPGIGHGQGPLNHFYFLDGPIPLPEK